MRLQSARLPVLCHEYPHPTTHDVSFFRHDRKVEHRDHHETHEVAPFKKTICRLIDLREILLGCHHRDLKSLSTLDDFSAGDRNLHRLTRPKTVDGHTHMA